MAGGDRDWAELLPELLESISERLTLVDYFRFGAVCTTWAAAADCAPEGLSRPPGMPFLLHVGGDEESCALVNINDRRPRSFAPIPGEMLGKLMVGSQDGWISLLDDHGEVSLLNPLTHARISLPSITTMSRIETVYNPDGSIQGFVDLYNLESGVSPPDVFRYISFKKIVLSSTPTADSYTAMAIFSCFNQPAIATAATGKWTMLNDDEVIDIIYHNGKFLNLSFEGNLWAVDPTLPSPELRMIAKASPEDSRWHIDKFLVDSFDDLLQVWRLQHGDYSTTASFKVKKFDKYQAAWVTLKSLGDRSLFLGTCYSISLSVKEIPELKPNSIYFSRTYWDWQYLLDPQEPRDVGVFSMEDGSLDHYCPADSRLNWPPPLWFTPSLT